MPRHSAPKQPAWLRPRLVVTLAVAAAGLATAVWLPTRNDSADAAERNRFGSGQNRFPAPLDRFADDFDGGAGSTVDPNKWILDTSRGDNGFQFSQSTRNARLDGDGNLLLTARSGDRAGATTARLVSRNTFRRESGRVEARVRVPGGEGLRPAITLAAGRPGSEAVDLLAEPVTDGDFHTYAMSWTAESLTLSVDGRTERRLRIPGAETGQAFRLVLSLAVTDPQTAELPARMAVDSINVDAAEEAEQPPSSPPSAAPSAPPSAPPSQEPSTPPAEEPTTPAAKAWEPFVDYAAGDIVTFEGKRYEVKEAHTSLPGWEPTALPSLFKKL
ncbi:beta-glucanase (GH16 family) [Pseudosporangium ferrugineum]|uniref:Beta-glucanase (GH16 family) n=1 Tax=Pseudosporangium ferrugineum TaxID=439699 RepID=A0A2T0SDM9_9ACTN|nr:beta-glucanase (GH16 family) [Pseudosporangium ferrugineum]